MKLIRAIFLFAFGVTVKAQAQVQPDHTVILIMENHSLNELYGNASAPYINSILNDPQTAFLNQSFALTHPSQPNYIMLFSGSAQGVVNDNLPTGIPFTTPNLGALLLQNGFGFKAYSEDLPSIGFTGSTSGLYARKHAPWVNWQASATNGIPAADHLPFTGFPTDFNTLPTLSFVIPNLVNDMHDGGTVASVAPGDLWVQNNLNSYIQWCKTHNSIFILTFDEDDASQNNRILSSVTGQWIRGGTYTQPITHYNVLRTIEDLYGLTPAGASVDSSVIKDIWLKTEICNNGSLALVSNLSGTTYQWQLNTGAGFTNISNNTNYSGSSTRTLQLSNMPSSAYGYQYRCMVNGTASLVTTLKFTDYWKGSVSTAWENPLNWSCGLPDANTDVIINSGTVQLTSNALIRSLVEKPAVSVTVKSTYSLKITN